MCPSLGRGWFTQCPLNVNEIFGEEFEKDSADPIISTARIGLVGRRALHAKS